MASSKRDQSFYSELKKINKEFHELIRATNEQSMLFDFSPSCSDYIKIIQDLYKSYPLLDKNDDSNRNGDVNRNGDGDPNRESDHEGEGEGEGDVDNHEFIENQQIERFHEEGAYFKVKCKLYIKSELDTKLNLLGLGTLFLKKTDDGKKQVIIRQEPDLRRVLMNEYITSSTPIKKKPKFIQLAFLSTIDGKKRNVLYTIKLRDDNEANDLYNLIQQ